MWRNWTRSQIEPSFDVFVGDVGLCLASEGRNNVRAQHHTFSFEHVTPPVRTPSIQAKRTEKNGRKLNINPRSASEEQSEVMVEQISEEAGGLLVQRLSLWNRKSVWSEQTGRSKPPAGDRKGPRMAAGPETETRLGLLVSVSLQLCLRLKQICWKGKESRREA